MIVFLTFGEYASGIYSSQVMDVCRRVSYLGKMSVKLVAIIPLRNFIHERKKIKNAYENSLVLPMFPKLKFYKVNILSLIAVFLFLKPKGIICRNAIPANLGLMLKRLKLVSRTVLDGRAAEYEQFKEYNLANDPVFTDKFKSIEEKAVRNVDYRIAVSQKLVDYWRANYGYTKNNHVIIPCTLNSNHLPYNGKENNKRVAMGYSEEDIILVYSGSAAQWQSFELLFGFLEEQLNKNADIKVILLAKDTDLTTAFAAKYPGRVKLTWCKEAEVINYLGISDYGILLRDNTWTNKVASPVKFAEYLNAGLQVIISPEVGDFSEFVSEHRCGFIYTGNYLNLTRVEAEVRNKNQAFVEACFHKTSAPVEKNYKELIKNITDVN